MPAIADHLPPWSWWLPLVLLHLGSWLSLPLQPVQGITLWYLPFGLGLVFMLWWGWRVLPAVFLNTLLSAPLANLGGADALLQALAQLLILGAAGLLLRRWRFDPALPDLGQLQAFILLAVLPGTLLLHLARSGPAYFGSDWLRASLGPWLLDGLCVLVIGGALLACLTPLLRRRGWALAGPGERHVPADDLEAASDRCPQPPGWLLVPLLALPWLIDGQPLLLGLPAIGLAMLILILGWGFSGALWGGALAMLWQVGLPLVRGLLGAVGEDWKAPPQVPVYLGLLLIMVAALMLGRSLSDLRQALGRSEQLRQRLALAGQALEVSPLGLIIADARQPNLPLVYCNPAFERLGGYARGQLLGRNCRFLLDDHEQAEVARLCASVRRGEACQAVLRSHRQDGSTFWNEVSLAPIQDEAGISHLVGLQQDVSARQRLGEELLRLTHLLSQTEAIADIGGWALTLADQSLFWSEGCYRLFELESSEGPPNPERVLDFFDADSRLLARRSVDHLLRQGGSFDLELGLRGARGTPRTVRVKGLVEREGERPVRIHGAIQDISARKLAERQLRERDDWLRLFFDAPLVGMAMISPQQHWLEVNYKLCQMLGYSREALREDFWSALTHPDDLAREEPLFAAIKAGSRESYELDKRFLLRDGGLLHARVNLRAVRDQRGKLEACLVLIEDISARQEAEARYRTLVEHAPEAILLFNPEEGLLDVNANALRLFARGRDELLGRQPENLGPELQADGRDSAALWQAQVEAAVAGQTPVFEWLFVDGRGQSLPCEVRLVRLPGQMLLIRGSVIDISERQRYQREIERLAFSDELTGLPNRRLLLDRLQHAMARERREGCYGALLFIDLDHFKAVNDSLGHPAGDALLREVSRRLGLCLRAQDTLARIGGDEFVILLEALADSPELAAERASEVGEKLLASLRPNCWVDGHALAIGASIGITLHPLGRQDATDVLKQADIAMYRAKQGGRNDLHFFAPVMQASLDQHLQLQNELRQALALGQLHLHFQPQRVLADGAVTGVEALLRWNHPTRGLLAAEQFIGLAEETGLICELGQWVLEQSCAALARWRLRWPQLTMAINFSQRELCQPTLSQRLDDCLRRHGLPSAALELDICEGVSLTEDEACRATLQALHALGVRFALDDFGIGYASLTGLRRLPLNRLKIGSRFVLDPEESGLMLLEAFLAIGQHLGLECVAEGIETQAQLDFLQLHGCALGQGFHLGRPMAEADLLQWLEELPG